MSNNIERLDLSKPPPGYEVFTDAGDDRCSHYSLAGELALNDCPHGSRDAALSAAWAHYQARYDPPAFTSDANVCEGGEWHLHLGDKMVMFGLGGRTVAWRRYLRRLDSWNKTMEVVRAAFGGVSLGDVMGAEFVGAALWPDILTWSEEKMDLYEAQVATAARKAARG